MEIVFKDVSYNSLLNNISFSIKKPGIYSFVGSSNSGKTIIGKLISGFLTQTKGIITVSINKSKIGYVNQNPYDMFCKDSVYNELLCKMKENNYKTVNEEKRIKDALILVGLSEEYLNMDPIKLSISESRKLALSCALIYNPKVIILDEVTNGLKKSDKKDLIRLLKLLKNKYNKIIIVLSKDTSFCYELSDYVYLMYQSRIIDSGKISVLENNDLNRVNLDYPNIVSFVKECNKKGHYMNYYTNILDLIKAIYREVH